MSATNKYRTWDIFLTTGFYSGFLPFAPGTMGALVATLLWLLAAHFLAPMPLFWLTLACVLVFTLVSIPSIRRVEREMGEDPSVVVVDEMVGVWIPLLVAGSLLEAVLAFALFRLFDIVKPLGCRRMERVGGGWGVMLDDILAGIYALIVLLIIQQFL